MTRDKLVRYFDLRDEIFDLEKRIPKEKIPTNYIANFYVYGVFATINEWFKNGMKESEKQMISYLKSIIENNYHNE